jgi:hypothetical protein
MISPSAMLGGTVQRFVGLLTVFGLLTSACGSTTGAATTVPVSTTSTAPAEPTTTVHVDTTVAAVPDTTTTTADAPAAFSSGAFSVPFSIVKPDNHGLRSDATSDIFYLEAMSGENTYLILTTRGPATLDDWRAAEVDQAIMLSEVPQETRIGGLPAAYLEFAVQDQHLVPGGLLFTFEAGDTGRVYAVDVDAEAITILAIAAPDLWTDFQSVVDELLSGLTWK